MVPISTLELYYVGVVMSGFLQILYIYTMEECYISHL